MAGLTLIDDTYNIRARLAPAVIVFLPLVFAVTSWFPGDTKWGVLAGVGVSLALGTLLSQLGRDLGKAKQSKLFRKFGGTPTTLLLAYRSSTLNQLTLDRCHEVLRQLRPDLRVPRNKDEELLDTASADAVYGSCTDALREISRDKAKFPLVFEENVNFGFRRNLWAMKPAAVATVFLSAVACFVRAGLQMEATQSIDPVPAAFGVACTMLLVFWCVRIRPPWVRTAAFAYAERLLGICETLTFPKPEPRIVT